MTTIDLSSGLAAEHARDLRAAAARRRLVALARCCQPASWRRAVTHTRNAVAATRDWIGRGQLRAAPACVDCV